MPKYKISGENEATGRSQVVYLTYDTMPSDNQLYKDTGLYYARVIGVSSSGRYDSQPSRRGTPAKRTRRSSGRNKLSAATIAARRRAMIARFDARYRY